MSAFLPFAELCDALAATTKKLEKRALIASYLKSLSVEDAGRAALWLSGAPFPETDPRVLNIGGALLQKAVFQLAGASSHALGAAYRRRAGCHRGESHRSCSTDDEQDSNSKTHRREPLTRVYGGCYRLGQRSGMNLL